VLLRRVIEHVKTQNWTAPMLRLPITIILCALLVACSSQVAGDKTVRSYEGVVATNLSGDWQRDYSRGDDVNRVVNDVFRQLQRSRSDPRLENDARFGNSGSGISQQDVTAILAIAQLADTVTRQDVLTISQTDHEMSIERKDDFTIFCEFYDGAAQGPETGYGSEVCGWDGHQFVSRLILPDGLRVTHRFTLADDGKNLHVATTVSSRSADVPVTLHRFYALFDVPESNFNCIETLSMKRVCSTGEIK
jgi:hypothetical protein